jgi:hypothetical protein
MFTIQVIDSNSGKYWPFACVSVDFGLWRGGTSWLYSDKYGECNFEAQNGQGDVYIKGFLGRTIKVHTGYLSGRVTVYV